MGNTPLHLAVQNTKYDFVKMLLENNADVSIINLSRKTALHLAAQMNSLRMVKMLIKKATPEVFNTIDIDGKTPFLQACSHGSENLISCFLSYGCDVNLIYGHYQDFPLLGVLSNPNLSLNTVNILLSAGANINKKNLAGQTALHEALNRSFSSSNLCSPAHTLYQNICCLLIDKGSDLNMFNGIGFTALHCAVSYNNELIVRKLLNCGSPVNAMRGPRCTPLFYACIKDNYKIVSMLVNNGADLEPVLKVFCRAPFSWPNGKNRKLNSMINFMIQKSKERKTLKNSCRLVIRKNLPKDVEKSALLLPLPNQLIEFIQLVE